MLSPRRRSPSAAAAPARGRRSRRLAWLAVPLLALAAAGVYALSPRSAPVTHPTPSFLGAPGSWVQTFDDEFDGNSLDTSVWRTSRIGNSDPRQPFNPTKEAAWFSASAVAVKDGKLTLTVRHDPRTVAGRSYPLSSGVVETGNHVLVRPGSYIEARVRVPRCDGCWPAFWQTPTDVWPPEIDTFEWFDSGQADHLQPMFNYHTPSGQQTGPTPYGDPNRDYRGGFHTFGVLWTNTGLLPVLDGAVQPQAKVSGGVSSRPMMLILNLSVMAGHEPPAGSQMQVDWVRVWVPAGSKKADSAAVSAGKLVRRHGANTDARAENSRLTIPAIVREVG